MSSARKWLAAAIVIIGVVLLWRLVLGVLAVVAAAAAAAFGLHQVRRWRALQRFRAHWGSRGKDLLLVYSNSPHWQRYVEDTWLPKWGHRAVVLNWSERSTWTSSRPEVALFRTFAGREEFNPIGILVPLQGRRVHIVRFWRAFRDHKHGKPRLLQAAEADLDRLLGATGDAPAR